MALAKGCAMRSMVRDVMTAHVVAVRSDASFKEMVARMRESRISAFPVVDGDGRVIGVVSEADFLDKEAEQADIQGVLASLLYFRNDAKTTGVTADELMTSPAVTVGPDTPVVDAARLMRDRRVKRLPVINTTGHLIGIISRTDVLGVFLRQDKDIQREVTDEVIPASGAEGPTRFTVTVTGGIVTLAGRPENDQAGRELAAAVRRVEGVVAVYDQLSYAGGAPR
jgi:CBS domain-containing protein